jgi:alpha/beta superfamily hydrolase
MARKIETHLLDGPAGRLEALLEEPEDRDPMAAAVICHPHPQHGGTMHNKVVYRLARGMRRSGYVVLRFNYRGVNLSEGTYDNGQGELDDARTALTWLRTRYPNLPYSLAGFSFGSRIVLRLGCVLPDVSRLIAVGYPTTYKGHEFLHTCDKDKVFIQSTEDVHGPAAALTQLFEAAAEPKRLLWVDSVDHFFKNSLDQFEEAVVNAASS